MRGIIWVQYFKNAKPHLNKMIQLYEYYLKSKPVNIKMNSCTCFVKFDNGDIWQGVRANESARGHSCNISYISKDIDNEFVECIIKHCTKAFPYQAYKFIDEWS